MTNNTSNTSRKLFVQKPWVLALITLGAIVVIALGVVAVLEVIKPVENTSPTVNPASDGSLMQTADATKKKAFEQLEKGNDEEALKLFKQARESYKATTPNATEDAPNNNVLDMDAQIDILENRVTPEQIENPGPQAR